MYEERRRKTGLKRLASNINYYGRHTLKSPWTWLAVSVLGAATLTIESERIERAYNRFQSNRAVESYLHSQEFSGYLDSDKRLEGPVRGIRTSFRKTIENCVMPTNPQLEKIFGVPNDWQYLVDTSPLYIGKPNAPIEVMRDIVNQLQMRNYDFSQPITDDAKIKLERESIQLYLWKASQTNPKIIFSDKGAMERVYNETAEKLGVKPEDLAKMLHVFYKLNPDPKKK